MPGLAEAQAHRRWLLAEGAANDFFDEEILIGNPNATAANVTITLLPEVFPGETDPPPPPVGRSSVPATSRYTFRVNSVAGLRPGAVSAVVECTNGLDIVVERSMTWALGQHRGAHNSQGVLAPDDTWYLAEGVGGFFQTFVLITNTNATQSADVEVKFLLESGATRDGELHAAGERAEDGVRQQRFPPDRGALLGRRPADGRPIRPRGRAGDVLERLRGGPRQRRGDRTERDVAVRGRHDRRQQRPSTSRPTCCWPIPGRSPRT